MITIYPGMPTLDRQPYTITIDDRIFWITHNQSSDTVDYNCFVDSAEIRKKLEEILRFHLTNGKNVLY